MNLQEQKVAYEQINHLGFWIEIEICILFDLHSLHSCRNVGKSLDQVTLACLILKVYVFSAM